MTRMDNGTPEVRPAGPVFLRLDERAGWQAAAQNEGVFYDPAVRGLRLGDPQLRPIPYTEPGGTFGGLTRPAGLAVGAAGRLFIAEPGRNRILTYTPALGRFVPLWEQAAPQPEEACDLPATSGDPGPYALAAPRGLALGPDGDLVVADTGHGRIIFYTWPKLLPRFILETGGEPWDVVFDRRGRLYVADSAAQRVWRYDRLWRRDVAYNGGAGELQRPRRLALDGDDRLYVLDDGLGSILRLRENGRVDSGFTLAELHDVTFPLPLQMAGETIQLLQDERPNCPALDLPGLSVDRLGYLIGVDALLLARPFGVVYPRQGAFRTAALDSGIYNCLWHRLALDADIPETTTLTIRTFTAAAPLHDERVAALPEGRWSRPIVLRPGDQPELLLQGEPGRYLWVEIAFGGDGSTTPVVRSLEIYAPRRSSLHFLPPPFHEDPVSANFLDRFLSYFDTIFAEVESQIERFTGYLDPDGAPSGEFLSWLASWFDIDFLAEWPEETRRAFVRRAVELHRSRGTIAGLLAVLQLHTNLLPEHTHVIEHFRLRQQTGPLYLAGRRLQPGPGAITHHFTVVLPNTAAPDGDAAATLNRLIAQFRPAHTRHELRLVEPGIRIGCQSTVGLDMIIGEPAAAPLGELRLGQSGLLAAQSSRPRLDQSFLR